MDRTSEYQQNLGHSKMHITCPHTVTHPPDCILIRSWTHELLIMSLAFWPLHHQPALHLLLENAGNDNGLIHCLACCNAVAHLPYGAGYLHQGEQSEHWWRLSNQAILFLHLSVHIMTHNASARERRNDSNDVILQRRQQRAGIYLSFPSTCREVAHPFFLLFLVFTPGRPLLPWRQNGL